MEFKMKFSYIIAVLALSLAACSKSSNKNTDEKVTQMQVPDQMTFSPSQPTTELTKEQILELKNTFAQKATMELPPTNLLGTDPDNKLTQDELMYLRSEEKHLEMTASANTIEMYKSMRQNCHKQRFDGTTETSIPLERVTQVSDLKTGDKFLAQLSASYSGQGCDADLGGGLTYQAKVERLETDALISAGASYNLKTLLKNTKYAEFLKSRGLIMTAGISALAAKQNVNTKNLGDVKGMVTFDLNGSYFTATQEIPYTTKYTILAKAMTESAAQMQVIFKMDIRMPNYVVQIDAEVIGLSAANQKNQQPTSERYFVNGFQKTRQEIQELFGDALKIQSAQNVQSTLM